MSPGKGLLAQIKMRQETVIPTAHDISPHAQKAAKRIHLAFLEKLQET